jgi:hypothetical protein
MKYLQRYDLLDDWEVILEPSPDGEWVWYGDVKDIIERLVAQVGVLQLEVDDKEYYITQLLEELAEEDA